MFPNLIYSNKKKMTSYCIEKFHIIQKEFENILNEEIDIENLKEPYDY